MVLWGILEAISATTPGITVPEEVNAAALAVMLFLGFKIYQKSKAPRNVTPSPSSSPAKGEEMGGAPTTPK
jgi:hypothetical protein